MFILHTPQNYLTSNFLGLRERESGGFERRESGHLFALDPGHGVQGEEAFPREVVGEHEVVVHHRELDARVLRQTLLRRDGAGKATDSRLCFCKWYMRAKGPAHPTSEVER